VVGLTVPDGSGAPERLRSARTGAEGAFELAGVPAAIRADLLLLPQDTAAARYVPTINPMAVRRSDEEDVFGLELYVLPQDPDSLIAGLRSAGIDLETDGGYVGQVVRDEDGALTAAADVQVAHAPPQGVLRFVNVLPRFASDGPLLRNPDADRTGPFGLFVVPSAGGIQDPVTFAPFAAEREFDTVVTPLVPGLVSYGVHAER